MSILRELSYTGVYLDVSHGVSVPLNFEWLGHAVSAYITKQFAGNRARAQRECVRYLVEALEIGDRPSWSRAEKVALERLANVLALIPELASWPAREKQALVATIRARGGRREFDYIKRLGKIPRLAEALHSIANEWGLSAGRTR